MSCHILFFTINKSFDEKKKSWFTLLSTFKLTTPCTQKNLKYIVIETLNFRNIKKFLEFFLKNK